MNKIAEQINLLMEARNEGTLAKLDSITADYLLQEVYETQMGIFDHEKAGKVLGDGAAIELVVMRQAEDIEMDIWASEFRRYNDKHVRDFTGESFWDFIQLPFPVVEMIYQLIPQLMNKEDNLLNGVMNNFKP